MFNNGTGILPVMNMNGNNGNGWGNDGGWWAWILLFAIFGWGNGGFGWGGNQGGQCCNNSNAQFTDAAIQRGFDNQTVLTKLEGIQNGIGSLGYDQLAQMNGLGNTVQQVGWNLQQTMNQNEIASMQRSFAAQQQASDCCCENRVGQMNIINQMDRNNCATLNAMNQNTQQLMWANQQGFRDISDQISAGFQQLEVSQLRQENARLTAALTRCETRDDLQSYANYVVNQVNPRTQPAYLTCNPNTGMVFPQAGMDQWRYAAQNNGCCNNNCNSCCNGF